MKKEEFIALGLTEELAEKAAAASKEELDKKYVALHRFNEVNDEKNQLKKDVSTRDGQIDKLKKDAGDNEDLKKQIENLQNDNKTATENHDKEMKELKLNNAIKLAISGKTHDEEIVTGLFDKTKLILGDDGKVAGLDEQMKGLKESKAYLFKEEDKGGQPQKPGFQIGGNPPGSGNSGNGNEQPSLKDALAARLQTN